MAAMFVKLLTDQHEMSNLYRFKQIASSTEDSYHVSVHLTKRFQRRRFLEINQSEKKVACGGHVC